MSDPTTLPPNIRRTTKKERDNGMLYCAKCKCLTGKRVETPYREKGGNPCCTEHFPRFDDGYMSEADAMTWGRL